MSFDQQLKRLHEATKGQRGVDTKTCMVSVDDLSELIKQFYRTNDLARVQYKIIIDKVTTKALFGTTFVKLCDRMHKQFRYRGYVTNSQADDYVSDVMIILGLEQPKDDDDLEEGDEGYEQQSN